MAPAYELTENPNVDEVYMVAGWRQWVDGGATSSALPKYLAKRTSARKIGTINPDGFYIFQLPGMQQFLRPVVRHKNGHPEHLDTPRNDFYYTEIDGKGLVIFVGDEPHLDAERYVQAVLDAARELNVRRIVMLGGIYAEVPYEKERYVTGIFSKQEMREEIGGLTVEFSNYQGPGSIGSYLCHRAGEQEMEAVGLYAFCPIYQFSEDGGLSEMIHIERDYVAWLNIMRRVNHMFKMEIALEDLEERAGEMIDEIRARVEKLDRRYPQLNVYETMARLMENFEERTFDPLSDVWEDELRRLGDQFFPSEE